MLWTGGTGSLIDIVVAGALFCLHDYELPEAWQFLREGIVKEEVAKIDKEK